LRTTPKALAQATWRILALLMGRGLVSKNKSQKTPSHSSRTTTPKVWDKECGTWHEAIGCQGLWQSSSVQHSDQVQEHPSHMHHNLRQNPTLPSWARSLSYMLHKIASMPIMCWLGTTRVRWLPSMWDPAQREHWSKGMCGCPRFLWLTL
jgi:hypothetical protein